MAYDDMSGNLQDKYTILKAIVKGILHLWNKVCAVGETSFLHLVQRRECFDLPLQ